MLNDTLRLLLRAGAPRELAERPLRLYMDSDTGELHGDPECFVPRGRVEVVSVDASDADGCDCVDAALDGDKELAELIDLGEEALELEQRLQSLSNWKSWLEEQERGSAVKLIHDNLQEARWVLAEVEKLKEKTTHQRAWLRKWVARLEKSLDTLESQVLTELRSEGNAERILTEAVRRLLTNPRSASEVECTRIDLGPEDLEFFGIEPNHPSPQIEWELRESYGWALSSNLTVEGRQEKLREVLLKHKPEVLTSSMFPIAPPFPPREGQTVEKWVHEVWEEETKGVALFVDQVLTRIVEGVRSQQWIALLHLGRTRDGIEEALVYQTGTHQGRAVLRLPEAVAYKLCNDTSGRREDFQAVKLEESDTPEIIETMLGLYDPQSPRFRYLDDALEAARLV